MKKKKIFILVFVLVVIFLIIVLSGIFKTNKPDDDTITDIIPVLDEKNIDSFVYDGLGFKMISCVFDKETGIGISIFEVRADDGNPEIGGNTIDYNGNFYSVLFSEEAGFCTQYEKKGKKILISLSYASHYDNAEDMFIGVYKNGDMDNEIGKFELDDRYKSEKIMYFEKNKSIVLSGIGFKMEGMKLGNENKVTLLYVNGKRRDIRISSSSTKDLTNFYEFEEYIDINGVEAIIDGDVEYNKSEQDGIAGP